MNEMESVKAELKRQLSATRACLKEIETHRDALLETSRLLRVYLKNKTPFNCRQWADSMVKAEVRSQEWRMLIEDILQAGPLSEALELMKEEFK